MTTITERRERPVRQPRPDGEPRPTRSTRSTRSTRPAPVPSIEKKERPTNAEVPVRVRPSTRSTRPSTRTTTRPPVRQTDAEPLKTSAPRRMIRSDAVTQEELPRSQRSLAEERNGARVRKSTRNVIRTEPGDVTRAEVFIEKRTQAKYIAPAQFLLVMFGVVIITVFAYGLLQPDEQALPEKPDQNQEIEFAPNSTSTNTGILRGE